MSSASIAHYLSDLKKLRYNIMYKLPSIEEFKSQSPDVQKQTLDQLFEPCDSLSWFIQTYVLHPPHNHHHHGEFTTYGEFIEVVRSELHGFLHLAEFESSRTHGEVTPIISHIISAHPRLGVPKKTAKLSEHSSAEQKNLAAGEGEEAEKMKELLIELNEEYEIKFPGLRYVVFVNGRGRPEIMEDMKKRIKRGDISLERKEAFDAICDIALDRAGKLGAKL